MKHIVMSVMVSLTILADSFITPLPQKVEYEREKALLGKKLFFETKLSKDNTISCASCHNLEKGGVDNFKFSFGIGFQEGAINTPTVLNAFFNFRQMWDGRADTLAQQVIFPIENPIEMGNSFENIIKTLQQDKEYRKIFYKNYPDGITKENIIDALVEFQKTLVTQSAFDDYLRGDENAITQKQKEGYQLFKEKGCISCHNGINIGGSSYAKIGIINPRKTQNLGLYTLTNQEMDRYFFKVPSLRNVAITYPYFHDGKYEDLQETIRVIANTQLGVELHKEEVEKIEAFLESLTGKVELIK